MLIYEELQNVNRWNYHLSYEEEANNGEVLSKSVVMQMG